MKTIVYQSYRTHDVATWITACMDTVRAWAASSGFDYEFIDDSFLDRAPAWFREKAGAEICPVTDLARLIVAREYLAIGYERTVWVDADMLVFAPGQLSVDVSRGFAFCAESWLRVGPQGRGSVTRRVNNSISVFVKGNVHLDFFIDTCSRLAQEPTLNKLAVVRFLTDLSRILRFQLLGNVGLFSPTLMNEIATGQTKWLPDYARTLPEPLACANLCGSLVDVPVDGSTATAQTFEAVVERCLASRGDVVNRWRPQAAS